MPFYSITYKNVRGGWHLDYDEVELQCPLAAVGILLYVFGAIALVLLSIPVLYFLCVAPKDRGRTLVSQADMQGDDDDDDDEDMNSPLRQGGNALGNSGMGGTGGTAGASASGGPMALGDQSQDKKW